MKVSKNSKYKISRKTQTTEVARQGPVLKEGSFRIFQHPLLQNIKKLNGEKNWRKKISFRKKSKMPEKLKGDPLGFFNIHSVAKHQ